MTHYSTAERSGASDWILGTIKRNPEGLLLLAAGAALLMRSSSSSRRIGSKLRYYERHVDPASRYPANKTTDGEGANPGRGAREYLSDVAETVSQTAKSYASTVTDMRMTRCRLFQTNRGVLRDKPNQAWTPPQSMY